MKKIGLNEIEALKIGAGILGSGGGGDPTLGALMTQCQIEKYGPVNMITIDELKEDDIVVPVGFAGSPSVASEQLDGGQEFEFIFQEIEKYLGKKPTVIMPVEIGGANAFTPFYVAGKMGVSVLDADGMGRAFPELQMVSFSLFDILPQTAFMADFKGNTVIINAKNNYNNELMIENIGRQVTIAMGSNAALVLCLLDKKQAVKSVVSGSVSLAIDIGKVVIEARASSGEPVFEVAKKFGGVVLGSGIIEDVENKTEGGFLRGTVKIVNSKNGKTYNIEYQNENLICYCGQDIIATTPDIIMILDSQSGQPVTTDALKYGLRVSILGLPCNDIWKTERGLELVGPRYFKYDADYVNLQK